MPLSCSPQTLAQALFPPDLDIWPFHPCFSGCKGATSVPGRLALSLKHVQRAWQLADFEAIRVLAQHLLAQGGSLEPEELVVLTPQLGRQLREICVQWGSCFVWLCR